MAATGWRLLFHMYVYTEDLEQYRILTLKTWLEKAEIPFNQFKTRPISFLGTGGLESYNTFFCLVLQIFFPCYIRLFLYMIFILHIFLWYQGKIIN